jgi:hypothetical protein
MGSDAIITVIVEVWKGKEALGVESIWYTYTAVKLHWMEFSLRGKDISLTCMNVLRQFYVIIYFFFFADLVDIM